MKRYLNGLILASLLLVLAGCNSSNEEDASGETAPSLVPVEAELNIEEQAQPGDEVHLETKITQGDEAVEDANEVLYEVWMAEDKEHSDMIEATHDGDGIYTASYQVAEEAVYFVQVHVTARDTHVMPRMEIIVGNPDATEEEEDPESSEENHDHDEGEDEDHEH